MTPIALQTVSPDDAAALPASMEDRFRTAMRKFTGIVSLVTSCTADGEWRGMAATAVTSVSLQPPTCLICVNRDTTLHSAVLASRRFCINAMHQEHHDLMWSFTSSRHRDSRFRSGRWREGRDGMPFLEDAQSNVFCEVVRSLSVGTHDVILGRVVEVMTRPDHDPLLYGDGTYLKQVAR
ncbi:flavin reductase family protein [Mesorhizobium sp. KR1-2]|uniref:flavin reductase family protein n=1 Tax=Mesorhizobium sp. KR1-2 TaxID=3156609 RepID=UPI0032B42E0A